VGNSVQEDDESARRFGNASLMRSQHVRQPVCTRTEPALRDLRSRQVLRNALSVSRWQRRSFSRSEAGFHGLESTFRRRSHHGANAAEATHRADLKAGHAELQAGNAQSAKDWWEPTHDRTMLAQTGTAGTALPNP